MQEILGTIVPLAISAAAVIGCLTILLIIVAVLFAGLDFELGGKAFSLRLKKRARETAPSALLAEPSLQPSLHSSDAPLADLSLPDSHQPVPQELEEKNEAKEAAESSKNDDIWLYITTKSLSELDGAFEPFMRSVGTEHIEFWQTDHLRRRENLGADRARDAVRDLATQNPSWAMPHAVLLEWALNEHDYIEARRHLDAGLTKTTSSLFGHVLSAGVRLIFKADDKHAALAFACEWSKADIPESIRAGAFVTLAELLKDAGDIEGYRVALEFASSLQPANQGRTFTLGYSYAGSNSRWAPAIWHYLKCVGSQDDGPIARNNVGIVYSHIDKAVAVKTYEQASKDGDKYAAANLSHLLIEDGYISIAQSLLASVEDPGVAAENYASASNAALVALRRTEEKITEITAAAKINVEPYKASLAATLRNLQRGGLSTLDGYYASADLQVVAQVDGTKAFLQLRAGNSVFEGSLLNQTTCFAGLLSAKGVSILSSEFAEFTLLNEGDGTLRLFRWPSTVALKPGVIAYELRPVQTMPELAPPPPPPTQGLLANALFQNALANREAP